MSSEGGKLLIARGIVERYVHPLTIALIQVCDQLAQIRLLAETWRHREVVGVRYPVVRLQVEPRRMVLVPSGPLRADPDHPEMPRDVTDHPDQCFVTRVLVPSFGERGYLEEPSRLTLEEGVHRVALVVENGDAGYRVRRRKHPRPE